MKSDISTFVLPAAAAASQRPLLTTQPNGNQLGFRFKTAHVFLLLGLIAPLHSFAASSEAPYCIAVNGGYVGPATGTTFVARNFSQRGGGQMHTVDGLHQDPGRRHLNDQRYQLPFQR